MISMNCPASYDQDFWNGFNQAMMAEWNITTSTGCIDVENQGQMPNTFPEYKALASKINRLAVTATADSDSNNTIEMSNIISENTTKHNLSITNFTGYFDSLLATAFSAQEDRSNIRVDTSVASEGNADDIALGVNTNIKQGKSQEQHQIVFLTDYSQEVFKRFDANGIAYPGENIAFVRNNEQYSTGTLSHEILHLVLEQEGYPKSCYVDKVHENQFLYSMYDNGKYFLVKKFDC